MAGRCCHGLYGQHGVNGAAQGVSTVDYRAMRGMRAKDVEITLRVRLKIRNLDAETQRRREKRRKSLASLSCSLCNLCISASASNPVIANRL